MATKQELINGVEMVVQEARRIGTALTGDQWDVTVDLDGWRGRQVLAHVASIGTIVAPFATNMLAAQPGDDAGAGTDIDQLNAVLVGARADKSIDELVAEIESAYRGVIDFFGTLTEEQLAQKRTIRGYKDVPTGDLMMRMVVLHGMAHIYSAYAGVFNAEETAAAAGR